MTRIQLSALSRCKICMFGLVRERVVEREAEGAAAVQIVFLR
jgi:hypothetical protein